MESTPMPRRTRLPDGRELVIRHVEAPDIDGLVTLYAGLDDESRYRRFFSIYQPKRSFFERMVSVSERGGVGLVVTIGDGAPVVAEAGYELLANGNGELAITVDRAWRGWLGPYLLDALVEVADSRGVPNLEADILATNRPMLALLHSRGLVVIPGPDWTVVRAVIGVGSRTPRWPVAPGGLRVLVEGSGGRWHAADATRGMDVLVCPGPEHRRPRCPALLGEPCPLAADADVIVLSLPPLTDRWSALRAAHPHLHPEVPVCVEPAPQAGGSSPGETVLLAAAGVDIVAAVRHLAARRGGDAPADQVRPVS